MTAQAVQQPPSPKVSDAQTEDSDEFPPLLTRNQFEDEFPVMFKFYRERGLLPDVLFQKVQEIQRRWKTGLVFWLTHDNQEIAIPEWVAVNVVINNKQNVQRGARICMSLNHTKGYGCNRRNEGACSYVHECALCGQEDHGVFQKKQNGTWMCNKLRKWNEEEKRFQKTGHGDQWKREEVLTALAKEQRTAPSVPTLRVSSDVASPSTGGLLGRSPQITCAAQNVLVGGDAKSSSGTFDADCFRTTSWENDRGVGAVGGSLTEEDKKGNDSVEQPPLQPPPAHPPPPRLPVDWEAVWCEVEGRYYYWHRPTNHTSWEDCELELESICIRHWRPRPGVESLESCIRVLQGERFIVTWTSGDAKGWVYGHAVEDPKRVGYFPHTVIVQARESARPRPVGELCGVSEPFTEPEEVGGFLSVEPGDVLRVVAPMERPFIWAFVERAGTSQPEVGWVPQSILTDAKILGDSTRREGSAIEANEQCVGLPSQVS
eukprot:TRINITY_DN49899_c0_g1_i1.p1 TRINITY_DN49899_c0_g1~~TRINITY_DN49899_c0_g1_i1.p1  ORF type:complete len:488 (+),score=74.35 TRINITY_DN49899_c0_g1_i1:146-1609(+)